MLARRREETSEREDTLLQALPREGEEEAKRPTGAHAEARARRRRPR